MSKSLWKQKDFMLMWRGQLASSLGTEVSGIALPLLVLAFTGSSAKAGSVAAIRGAVYVIWAIPAGTVMDRWNRKLVMFVANLGSGIAMGSIALGLALHQLTIIDLYVACAVEGSFFVFANLGRFASLTQVVSKEQFAAASSLPVNEPALLAGPPLEGFLYQTIGGFATFLADSLSYFINAFSIFFITAPLSVESLAERKAFRHEIKEAFAWYWKQPITRFLNLITAGRTAVLSGLYLLVVVLAKEHHASSSSIGLIFAGGAIGGILSSFINAKIHSHLKLKQLLLGINILTLIFFLLYGFASHVWMLALITATVYAIDPLHYLTTATYSRMVVPDKLRGRVLSFTRIQVFAANFKPRLHIDAGCGLGNFVV
jgi:MFS family permease